MSQVVIRKNVIDKAGLLDEQLTITHDRELYLRLLPLGEISQIDDYLVTKVMYPSSLISANQCNNWLNDGMKLFEIFYSRPENQMYLPYRQAVEESFIKRVEVTRNSFIQSGLY